MGIGSSSLYNCGDWGVMLKQEESTSAETSSKRIKNPPFKPVELKKVKNPGQTLRFCQGFRRQELPLLTINMEIINLVDAGQTYNCPYMLFLIPFALHTAQTLTFYDQEALKNTYLRDVFDFVVEKIKSIQGSRNPQLDQQQLKDCLFILHTFSKRTSLKINTVLRAFFDKHRQQMKACIPVWYHLFKFCAQEKYMLFDQMTKEGANRAQCTEKLKKRFGDILKECSVYHNDEI